MKLLLIAVLILFSGPLMAHGGKDRDKNETQTSPPTTKNNKTEADKKKPDAVPEKTSQTTQEKGFALADLSFSRFDTLHPLIVHFPVTLIPLAFILYLVAMLMRKNELKWTATIILAAGLGFAYAAAFPYHPHTTGLTEEMRHTLSQHDFFAYSTLFLSTLALFTAILSCIRRFSFRAMEFITAVILLVSTLSVTITGHYGGTLTHVHGVGPQGKYLDKSH